MVRGHPALRDDLERVMVALDRAPHTRQELAAATGIQEAHLAPRIETLLDQGYISRWDDGEEPVLALTWPGRYRIQPARFQAAALAAVGAGLAAAAGLAAWAAGTTSGGGGSAWAPALAVLALGVLGAAAARRPEGPEPPREA